MSLAAWSTDDLGDGLTSTFTDRFTDRFTDDSGAAYLGVDLGTDGLSAAWAESGQVRPLGRRDRLGRLQWRRPAVAWLSQDQASLTQAALPAYRRILAERPVVAGAALAQAVAQPGTGLLLRDFKPWLMMGLPWLVPGTAYLEPRLALSETRSLPLVWAVKALEGLLADLTLRAQAATAIVLPRPVGATAAWLWNVRDAATAAGWGDRVERLHWVEEPIATALGWLAQADRQVWDTGHRRPGALVVIHGGATAVQVAAIALPLATGLSGTGGFGLSSRGLALDAIAQILCPLASDRSEFDLANLPEFAPAEIDPSARLAWRLRLASSARGQALLGAAERLALQLAGGAEEVALTVADRHWSVRADPWRDRLLQPWFSQLDQTINDLLARTRLDLQRCDQILLTGRLGATAAIADWARHKFPGSQIQVDRPQAQEPIVSSRRALGLAAWPQFAPLLNLGPAVDPYGDDFLLSELLRLASSEPLPIDQLFRRLESQGVNVRTCGDRLLALLNGHVPIGLLPDDRPGSLVTASSLDRPDYRNLRSSQPFIQTEPGHYGLEPEAALRWRRYLGPLLARSHRGPLEPTPLG